MRDPAYDETKLPALPELGERDVVCGFCRFVFERPLTGRPPRFCSKRCRQAEHREREGAGYGYGSSPRRRRVDCRSEAEYAAIVAAGERTGFAARVEARDRAAAAWPFEAFPR